MAMPGPITRHPIVRRLRGARRLMAVVVVAVGLPEIGHGQPRRWSLPSQPAFDVGAGPDSTHELSNVAGAVRLADARIVIGNAGTELRFYAPDGRYLYTRGRSGAGPGEYVRIMGLLRGSGDSLVVFDGEQGRVSVLSSDGELGRTITGSGRWMETIVAHGRDGSFIAGPVYQRSAQIEPTVRRMTHDIQRVGPDGEQHSTLVRGLTEDSYFRRGPPQAEMAQMPFAMTVHAAAASERVYIAASPEYLVEVVDFAGTSLPPIRRTVAQQRVTDDHIRQYTEEYVAGLPESRRDAGRAVVERMPKAPVLPAIADLETDALDNLWARDFAISSRSPSTWTVFAPDGRPIATITLPAGFAPSEIGADWILGRQLDHYDVEHVVLYEIRKH